MDAVGVVHGVTEMDKVMYVVCERPATIKRYTADTLSPLAEDIHVKRMRNPCDIVACRHDCRLFVADEGYCVWQVSPFDQSYVKWLPTESSTDRFHVYTLSLTSGRLLVTLWHPATLRQYSTTSKELLCVVELPKHVLTLYHGVETVRGTFVVGHKGMSRDYWQYAVSEL